MGVINITPNSFSDGDKYNNSENFEQKLKELIGWADIVDIGAESTAPFNKSVSLGDEVSRFKDIFYPVLENTSDPEVTLSIDTYKLETFREVYKNVRNFWPKSKVVFNDISGKIDEDLLAFLGENPEITYVFSHNLCPSREKAGQHMDYAKKCSKAEFLVSLVDYFKVGLEKLANHNNEVWIDPCFGFSKTREQNHHLIRHFKSFLLQVPYEIPCVLGLSRKSFLRFPADADIKTEIGLKNVEQVHSNLLFYLFRSPLKRELIIRTHDPAPVDNAQNALKLFEL